MLKWLVLPVLLLAPVLSCEAANRNLLWATVQACVAAKRVTGVPFPCLAVDGQSAALRVPGSLAHVVVMPTTRVIGLETPTLQDDGNVYWRAALAARHYVADAAGGGMPLENVAVAINSSKARTQDQLHIHLDCARDDIRSLLLSRSGSLSPKWTLLPFRLVGQTFFGRTVEASQIETYNPFLDVKLLPIGPVNLHFVSFAAVWLPAGSGSSAMIVLATLGMHAKVEDLTDRSCSAKRS